jgi:PAS domain S-box-containing protein
MTSQRSRQSIRQLSRNRPSQRGIAKHIQAVFDALPAHLAALDANGTILAVNAAWRQFVESTGFAGDDCGVGHNYLDICRQAPSLGDARLAEQAIAAIIAREHAEYSYEYACHSPGEQRWFRCRAARFAGGGPICVLVSHEDITQYKQLEQRAQRSEMADRHAKRLDILHEFDRAILSAGALEDAAQAVLRMIYGLIPYWRGSVLVFDLERGEFQLVAICRNGVPMETPAQHFSIAESAEANASLPALLRGETYVFELRDMLPSWPEAAELLAAGMRYQICTPLMAQGELFGSVQLVAPTLEMFDSIYLPTLREVLDSLAIGVRQARLLDQVRAGREQLRELSRRLVAAQELERRQLARELHDQIGQNLAVLNMNLANTRNQLSHESRLRVDARLAEAVQLVDQTIEQIRNVMAELRPAILDDFGLVAALRWYARHFARHTDLVVLLEIEEPRSAPRLPAEIETALFRVAQEALTNVIKHAGATLATVNLTMLDQTIRLAITDDGVGFNSSAARRPRQRSSLGLMTMQERMAAVDGRLAIDSAPGQGTRIIAEVAR